MAAHASFVRAGALLLAIGLPACAGTVGADGPSPANPLDEYENALIYELNQVRTAAGIAAPVVLCTSLNVSAAAHSDDMRDKAYLSDQAPDGSSVRSRACTAGYTPGCNASEAMAELVASGIDDGKATVMKWASDPMSNAVMTSTTLLVAGTGRTMNLDGLAYWTLDLADKDDPSCH
jgi:uncharacterized protein YkwD